jgi:CheY-like chemotaxis protein
VRIRLSKKAILLIEDRDSTIALLLDAPPSHDYAVLVVRDGAEALALARALHN